MKKYIYSAILLTGVSAAMNAHAITVSGSIPGQRWYYDDPSGNYDPVSTVLSVQSPSSGKILSQFDVTVETRGDFGISGSGGDENAHPGADPKLETLTMWLFDDNGFTYGQDQPIVLYDENTANDPFTTNQGDDVGYFFPNGGDNTSSWTATGDSLQSYLGLSWEDMTNIFFNDGSLGFSFKPGDHVGYADHIKVSVTYDFADAPPSPVPVPGAVWLLGSGLLGLIGYKKRKST